MADGCAVRINLPATFQFSPATSKSIDIDKRPFFTTFDYIVAVIQALQFVDYKDVLRLYFLNAI
jgi:hypothetical protein